MKYVISVLPILILFSQFEKQNDCIEAIFSQIDKKAIGKYEKLDTKNEYGLRQTVDSINYAIIRRWKEDKTPILEHISNEYSSIDSWKAYYEDGKVKEFGFMTTSNHTKIGAWNYFSESGKIDSIINYDEKYKVSFCEFYKIAADKNLTGKTSIIEFDSEKRKWIIEKWLYNKDAPTATGIELQVDSMKITDFKLSGEY